jgi:hypothetical protein
MSGLHRATPAEQVLELTRRLAEDYPSVALPEVSRVVQAAADRLETAREQEGAIAELEALARRDLAALIKPGRDAPGRSGAHRGAPRRGAASHG